MGYKSNININTSHLNPECIFRGDNSLRGPGGVPDLGMVKIEFSIVLDRGEPKLPDAFYRIKKY